MSEKELEGKVAIVTGASRGIGRAIAERFAAEGATVVVNYVSAAGEAKKVVDRIKQAGGDAVAVRGDVSKSADVKALVAAAVRQYGRVDILVNNAGVMGRIINMSSNSGLYHPSAMRFTEYVVSKAGLNGLTKALALAWGPHITVNAICPGWIKTDMIADTDPEVEKRILAETALGRWGTPYEIAGAAVFLASNDANFITGELLIVAGGRGMH